MKLADIDDNLDPQRVALLDSATAERLAAKYREALTHLSVGQTRALVSDGDTATSMRTDDTRPSFLFAPPCSVCGKRAVLIEIIPPGDPQQPPTVPPTVDRSVLPIPSAPFEGSVGLRANESTPSFPRGVAAPDGAPNVVLILLDDVGFGATAPFGGPINAPTIQQVCDTGLRYNCFHTTAL